MTNFKNFVKAISFLWQSSNNVSKLSINLNNKSYIFLVHPVITLMNPVYSSCLTVSPRPSGGNFCFCKRAPPNFEILTDALTTLIGRI